MTFVGWMETVRTVSLAAIILFVSCNPKVPEADSNEMKNSGDHKFTNALIEETSPYLLQHAHNPVNWHAWNDATLEKAVREDKMLLVSIGYAACHWCHVMEHETFENEEVAEIMNQHFICVKVDREERPDVDQYYMSAVNLITGGGGWPLNCFALPDGRPFHGGTYFRTEDWKRLLHTVANEYRTNREKLSGFAGQISQGIKQGQLIKAVQGDSVLDVDSVHRSVINWMQQFDKEHGGDNRAPKFPLPDNYLFLMRYAHQFDKTEVWDHVERTLKHMGNGGIYDQAGGGFCRYSVDAQWQVPHFEKMLYDNAQLIQLYAEAYKKTGDSFYLQIAVESAEFCMRELLSPEGVFYSSLDADSEGEEGKFYTWSEDELVETAGDLMDFARLYFQLDSRGKWEGRFILMRNLPEEVIREELGLSAVDYMAQKTQLVERLMLKREQRIRPALDDKSLTSWNALMVTGLVNLYQASGDERYLHQARTTLHFLLQHQWKKALLYHNYKNGRTTIPGFLEDYAFLIAAILKMNEADPGAGDLLLADELTQAAIERFYHNEDHIFQFTAVRSKEFHVAPVEVMDNVTPSSNAVMVSNLRKMYLVTGKPQYHDIYLDLLRRIVPSVVRYGSGYSHWMQVVLDETVSPEEIVIIGKDAIEKARDAGANYMPGTLLLTAGLPSDLLIFRDRYTDGKTWIYVCRNRVCQRPVESLIR